MIFNDTADFDSEQLAVSNGKEVGNGNVVYIIYCLVLVIIISTFSNSPHACTHMQSSNI